MAKLSPLIKALLVAVILMVNLGLSAQAIEYLDANNIKAGFGTGGNLFTKLDSFFFLPWGGLGGLIWDKFEVPKGSGKNEIYSASLWMSAIDQNGRAHCIAQKLFEYGPNFFDGPIASSYGGNYRIYYHRVFKVTQMQISTFRGLSFPTTASQVDSAILHWPGRGNPSVFNDYGISIDSPLAPFVDINHNGIYEPLEGEYPAVVGDQNIFFVFNDVHGDYSWTGGTPFGMEIRGLASSFVDSSSSMPFAKNAINNSLFIQYELENKSQNTYSDFRLGVFVDPDIGCFNNDYVGCDTNRNLMFAYNGVNFDPDCLPELGYDSLPVALGVQFLNQALNIFTYIERPMGAVGEPSGTPCSVWSNFLHGLWGDNTSFEYGGSGYNSGGVSTKFCFPGNPTDSTGWSEAAIRRTPGDRNMIGALAPVTFYPGEVRHLDLGYTSTFDSTSNHISIVDTLKRDADTVRSFYLNRLKPAQKIVSVGQIKKEDQLAISIYPNPASDQITIISGDNIRSLELMDIQGRILLTQPEGAKTIILQVSNLAKGVYLVNIQCTTGAVVKRIVVE